MRSDPTPTPDEPSSPLHRLGWGDTVAAEFERLGKADLVPGRVAAVHRVNCEVVTADGTVIADPDPEAMARLGASLPAVGDWVALARRTSTTDKADLLIAAVLPRSSIISRRDPADRAVEQVLAANIDGVLVVHGLDREVNLSRIERTLVVAWDSGAVPVVVLTKADLLGPDEVGEAVASVRSVALDVAVRATSAVTGLGIDELRALARPNRTLLLIGASGTGKSTLVNRLVGEDLQPVTPVREVDAKGRHTTTRRQLFALPGGGVLVDTPGTRSLGLWDAEDGIGLAFADVEELATACRFADCTHRHEPDCAVIDAVADGRLAARRLDSYRRLHDELIQLRDQQEEQRRTQRRRRR